MRATAFLFLLLLAPAAVAAERDLRPLDHGLRYVGKQGLTPVTVEITLRELPGGSLEYIRWVGPRGWAGWLSNPYSARTTLAYRDERLVTLSYEDKAGRKAPPADAAPGLLDELAVFLRARADIARGARQAEYLVWRADGSQEPWSLTVSGPAEAETPNGTYQCLRFRLGDDDEWVEGCSAPLLVFHFVTLVHWREGRKVSELRLEEKQL
jgi:hypothetical protein